MSIPFPSTTGWLGVSIRTIQLSPQTAGSCRVLQEVLVFDGGSIVQLLVGVTVNGLQQLMSGLFFEQKEKDLELAARIGQGLLARNKALEERLVTVEGELTTAHDTVTQLKHDLLLKSELLQIYTNDFDDSSPEGGESL